MGIGHRTITLDRLARQTGAVVNDDGVVVMTPELVKARTERIAVLENNARKLEGSLFSPGVYAILPLLNAAGSVNAHKVLHWTVNLWTIVSQNRALINAAATPAAVNNVSVDFEILPAPAVTSDQLMQDVARLMPDMRV